MILAIDFDGTCVTHDFPRIGKDIGAAPVLQELVQAGHNLILNTMRSDGQKSGDVLMEALKWFESNHIPLYGVNENRQQKHWTSSPKVFAHVYIDDAALGCPVTSEPGLSDRPFVDWVKVRNLLLKMGLL